MMKAFRRGRVPFRHAVQAVFLGLCAWIGVEFLLFMRWGANLEPAAYAAHPPGAEGFLPISALLSLKYWVATGRICELHPAGLFIFLAILAVALLLRKAFCSWLCPVGTLSEALWRLGSRLFGRTFEPPRWLDYPLRALKYLLLLFFVWVTLAMDPRALEAFLYSPFNAAADIRMYLFFAEISAFALTVLLVLAALSLLVRNVWCRYLCPYGALLGATRNVAYSYREEAIKGTITAGKIADLVILDDNPLTIAPDKIRDIQVLETIKRGKTIYRRS